MLFIIFEILLAYLAVIGWRS